MNTRSIIALLTSLFAVSTALYARQKPVEDRVLETMKKATVYMMDEVSCNGGFVWYYLPDFSRRWGEMEARSTMVWTQAPGTPQVGNLMLDAYHATGDEYYYESAMKVARALIWGQLECGGWNYMFDFAGEDSLKDWYSTIGRSGWRLEEFQHYYGNATFDDACTTTCAKFLLRMYMEKYDPSLRPSLDKAIDFVLKSQYPSGGWPQRWPLMYDHPFQGKADYTSFITLNDDVIPEATDFLMQCRENLGMTGLDEPILRSMYLIIILQQGQPYAGWSDQYTVADLKPAHARSYEPCGINSATTVSMIRLLMDYYRITGDTRFLSGIPAAIDFLESIRLPDAEVARWGRPSSDPDAFLVPRFIDPQSGTPLYVHREGSNAYNGRYFTDQDISGTITHYSSAVWVNTEKLRREYAEVLSAPGEKSADTPADISLQTVEEIIGSLDSRGRWLSPLRNTSNPYKPGADTSPSRDTRYVTGNVGDEYDTSPYRCESGELCISTKDYIDKMTTLIQFTKNRNKK